MSKTVIVQLTDDIDGGVAEETVTFALDGKGFEIDLNKKNATALRKALAPYIDKGRSAGRVASGRGGRRQQSGGSTLFSQLDPEERDRFRRWAELPNARRIADARVQEWMDAGRP